MTNKQREKIIRELPIFKNKTLNIKPLEGGMTNYNYLITEKNNKYVARFAPNTLNFLGLSRKREIHNYKSASKIGIGARVISHHSKHNLLIVEYLSGEILTQELARKPEVIKELAYMFKKLHKKKGTFAGKFDPITRAKKYIRLTEEKNGWFPKDFSKIKNEFNRIIKLVKPFSKKDPAHLDIMLGNVLVTQQGKTKLIDWEYASNADYRYDLAMLSVKAGFSQKEDEILAKMYHGKKYKKFMETLNAMKAIVYYAEASYGLLQNAISKKKIDYKKYVQANINGFNEVVKNI